MNPKKFDLMVVGEINPDLILQGNVMPEMGQVEKFVDAADLVIGSSSVIFACGAARLGLRVAMVGKIGADVFGAFMRVEMEKHGIDISGVRLDPNVGTGLTVILSRGVDRAILTYAGAMHSLSLADIDPRRLVQARHLHIGGYFLHQRLIPDVPKLFDMAHARGITTSLDTNYDPTERWEGLEPVLRRTDYFLPNETELLRIADLNEVQPALEKLSGLGGTVAVKQGAQGAQAMRAGQVFRAESLKMRVVDTTGAGDTFNAGFIYGVLQDWPLERALRMGTVCGALSTQAVGGTQSQPTLDEAMRYVEEQR